MANSIVNSTIGTIANSTVVAPLRRFEEGFRIIACLLKSGWFSGGPSGRAVFTVKGSSTRHLPIGLRRQRAPDHERKRGPADVVVGNAECAHGNADFHAQIRVGR